MKTQVIHLGSVEKRKNKLRILLKTQLSDDNSPYPIDDYICQEFFYIITDNRTITGKLFCSSPCPCPCPCPSPSLASSSVLSLDSSLSRFLCCVVFIAFLKKAKVVRRKTRINIIVFHFLFRQMVQKCHQVHFE